MIPDSKAIEEEVLRRITPSPSDRQDLMDTVNQFKGRVQSALERYEIEATAELVGSTAKDTYLLGSMDIDVFLVFDQSVGREKIKDVALEIGREILVETEECYAEHPYIRGLFEGIKAEIVPCYKIDSAEEKVTAVDRTPLHTRYIIDHITDEQRDEVRLFKRFLKGIECYGAEAEIEGFSGYLCELIILYYGSFSKAVEGGSSWVSGLYVSLENMESSVSFDAPLVFIDPVDASRNVASALSKDSFEVFVDACKKYCAHPRLTFFFPKPVIPWPVEQIDMVLSEKIVFGILFPRPPCLIAENLFPQVRKTLRAIVDACVRFGFSIDDAFFEIEDESVVLVILPKEAQISETELHMGPPVHLKKNAQEFFEKWKGNPRTVNGPFEKEDRLFVEIRRQYVHLRDLLEGELKSLTLGKDIDALVKSDGRIVGKKELIDQRFLVMWTKHLDGLKSWER